LSKYAFIYEVAVAVAQNLTICKTELINNRARVIKSLAIILPLEAFITVITLHTIQRNMAYNNREHAT